MADDRMCQEMTRQSDEKWEIRQDFLIPGDLSWLENAANSIFLRIIRTGVVFVTRLRINT